MAAVKLTGSVGICGTNKKPDILTIQRALNDRITLIAPTVKLKEDGSLGLKPEKSKTVAAIMLFQKKVVHMIKPDGLINIDGTTHRKLNSTTGTDTTALLTFPGTTFTHGKTRKTVTECLATLPVEMRADFKTQISHIIREMHKLGFVFGVPKKYKAGYRTFQEQFDLPANRTKAGPGESFHNYGLAADLGVIDWVDNQGKNHADFWLGTMDRMPGYKGFSAKIWSKRNAFGGSKVHNLSWEIIHLQGVVKTTSGRSSLAKCLNKASDSSGFSYQKSTIKSAIYQCKTSRTAAWVDIGTAKELWSGAVKNVSATEKMTIISHMKAAEKIAKTIVL